MVPPVLAYPVADGYYYPPYAPQYTVGGVETNVEATQELRSLLGVSPDLHKDQATPGGYGVDMNSTLELRALLGLSSEVAKEDDLPNNGGSKGQELDTGSHSNSNL
jgi:hypothetical protein